MLPAPITLTSDFGLTDHYVGQMKGAILRVAPAMPIVDITHAIAPQDIRTAAFLLGDLGSAFPPGTVHLTVVDPGVGSSRRILAMAAAGQFYIAPDNGLLTILLERFPQAEIVAIGQTELAHRVRPTFHGRDIMAPAAARLARDQKLAEIGAPLDSPAIQNRSWIPEVDSAGRVAARIVRIDNFGNLITNVWEPRLAESSRTPIAAEAGEFSLQGLRRYYSEVPEGEPMMLIGSSGYLEIAVNGGSAAARWGARLGDPVTIITGGAD